MKYIIYHNPRCSKSRETLKILQDAKVEIEIIEYLKTPPSKDDLKELLNKLKVPIKDIVRTKESIFSELCVDLEKEEEVLRVLSEHPVLIERPIVIYNNRAVVGRPPENVLKLL